MIKTRIAGTAAFFALGLAALGGTVVAIAAPASAETATISVEGTQMTQTAGQAVDDARQIPEALENATRGPDVSPVPAPGSAATVQHLPFPHSAAPHSEHNGQGHKGSNNQPHSHRP